MTALPANAGASTIRHGFNNANIYLKTGVDWRTTCTGDRRPVVLRATDCAIIPEGRSSTFYAAWLTGEDAAMTYWLGHAGDVMNAARSHLHVVVDDPRYPGEQHWLANVVVTSFRTDSQHANRGQVLQRTLGDVRCMFISRGELAHLPLSQRMPLAPPPDYAWMAAAREGDMVWLSDDQHYARLQTGLLLRPGGPTHRVVLDRYTDDNHRIDTQIWYVDGRGCGIDGHRIMQPVQGWLRTEAAAIQGVNLSNDGQRVFVDMEVNQVLPNIELVLAMEQQRQEVAAAPPPARNARRVRINPDRSPDP